MKRYEWKASTKGSDGRPAGPLGGGHEEDLARAIELAKEMEARLRAEGRRGWIVGVLDTKRPIIAPSVYEPGEMLFFAEG